jgi:hypothetical protein
VTPAAPTAARRHGHGWTRFALVLFPPLIEADERIALSFGDRDLADPALRDRYRTMLGDLVVGYLVHDRIGD